MFEAGMAGLGATKILTGLRSNLDIANGQVGSVQLTWASKHFDIFMVLNGVECGQRDWLYKLYIYNQWFLRIGVIPW